MSAVNQTSELQAIHTSCEQCDWQKREGLTQTGCLLGRLDKFGDCVIEAYDGDHEFNIINGRICTAKRPKGWRGEDSKEEAQARLQDELRIKFDVVLIYRGNLDNLKATLESLNDQLHYSSNSDLIHITIVHNELKSAPLVNFLRTYNNYSWAVEHVHEESPTDLRMIDLAVNHLKHPKQYYAVFEAGYAIPPHFFSCLNYYINEQLGRFCILKPYNGLNGLTIQNMLHKIFVGNHQSSILEKIDNLELNKDMIKECNEICPMNNPKSQPLL